MVPSTTRVSVLVLELLSVVVVLLEPVVALVLLPRALSVDPEPPPPQALRSVPAARIRVRRRVDASMKVPLWLATGQR
jgi:hypothetical protein